MDSKKDLVAWKLTSLKALNDLKFWQQMVIFMLSTWSSPTLSPTRGIAILIFVSGIQILKPRFFQSLS